MSDTKREEDNNDVGQKLALEAAPKAVSVLEGLLVAEDPKLRMEAAKTILDRAGHPAVREIPGGSTNNAIVFTDTKSLSSLLGGLKTIGESFSGRANDANDANDGQVEEAQFSVESEEKVGEEE